MNADISRRSIPALNNRLEDVVIQQASLAGFGVWGWKRALCPVEFGGRRQGFKPYFPK
jgi:hypothetical protein